VYLSLSFLLSFFIDISITKYIYMDCASCQAGGKKRVSKKSSKKSKKSSKKGTKKQKGGLNAYMEERVKLNRMLMEDTGVKKIAILAKLVGELEAKAVAKNPAITSVDRIKEAIALYIADKASAKAKVLKLAEEAAAPAPARAAKRKSKKASKKSSKKSKKH
jgi:hypothetical protein